MSWQYRLWARHCLLSKNEYTSLTRMLDNFMDTGRRVTSPRFTKGYYIVAYTEEAYEKLCQLVNKNEENKKAQTEDKQGRGT